jgi:hypothetical protein
LVTYPKLSKQQQSLLPELIQAIAIPSLYDDSTHQLWDCETTQGDLILKVCNNTNVRQSRFWQGMNFLFSVDLIKQLGEFQSVYTKIAEFGSLKIPDYIASSSFTETAPAFIACKKLAGSMVMSADINIKMVRQLADHIAVLHQHQNKSWGQIRHPEFDRTQWPGRLQNTLIQLAKDNHAVSATLLDEAVEQAGEIKVENFVPVMVDLRWDQFLQQDGIVSALVDLDAFVYAPRELEWVLLEYLLDRQQMSEFCKTYQQITPVPVIEQVRKPYRLLLFLMNVLGEQDSERWMMSPALL